MTEAFPLQWPAGWTRTERAKRSAFQCTMHQQVNSLYKELRLLGAENIVLSTNQPVKQDGMPYSVVRIIDDPGVAVYFELKGNEQCIPCDKWDYLKDNIRAIVKTIEALRGLERWGAKEMVDAAFRGFKSLPSPDDVSLAINSPQYFADCVDEINGRERYRNLVKELHPDKNKGENSKEFYEVQRQWTVFKSQFGDKKE